LSYVLDGDADRAGKPGVFTFHAGDGRLSVTADFNAPFAEDVSEQFGPSASLIGAGQNWTATGALCGWMMLSNLWRSLLTTDHSTSWWLEKRQFYPPLRIRRCKKKHTARGFGDAIDQPRQNRPASMQQLNRSVVRSTAVFAALVVNAAD
jgi:hypothetical protein